MTLLEVRLTGSFLYVVACDCFLLCVFSFFAYQTYLYPALGSSGRGDQVLLLGMPFAMREETAWAHTSSCSCLLPTPSKNERCAPLIVLPLWHSRRVRHGQNQVMPAVNCTGPPQRHVALELWESGASESPWRRLDDPPGVKSNGKASAEESN